MHTVPPLFGAGDIVTVRQWEDMAAQYGITAAGSIKVPLSFTTMMRDELCGRQFMVTKTYEIAEGWGYILDGVRRWQISEEMLECQEEEIDLDTDKLFELFG